MTVSEKKSAKKHFQKILWLGTGTTALIWRRAACDFINNLLLQSHSQFDLVNCSWNYDKFENIGDEINPMSFSIQAEERAYFFSFLTRIYETTKMCNHVKYLLPSVISSLLAFPALWLYQCTVFDRNANASAVVCMRLCLVRWNGQGQWTKACRYYELRAFQSVNADLLLICFSPFTFSFFSFFFLIKKVRSRLASVPQGDRSYSKCDLIKGSGKG